VLVLGDNIFYGHGCGGLQKPRPPPTEERTVFGYYVNDPERYGVGTSTRGRALSIEENQPGQK